MLGGDIIMGDVICIWPDDVWCFRENLESYLDQKSTDYDVVEIDSKLDTEAICEYVKNYNSHIHKR